MGKKIKNYIESGDVMQLISHEVTAHFDIEPIYLQALRLTNPSPYTVF